MPPVTPLVLLSLAVSACATWPAESGPRVMRVAGTDLPVLTSEPDVDKPFVVPADWFSASAVPTTVVCKGTVRLADDSGEGPRAYREGRRRDAP